MKKYSWAIVYAFVAGLIFPNAFAAEKTENKTPAKTQTQTKAPAPAADRRKQSILCYINLSDSK